MANRVNNKYFFWILLVLLIFGGTTILLNTLINYPPFQQYLIHQLSQNSQYDIETGEIRIGFRGGLGLHADHVKARSKLSSHHLKADKVDISFNYGELLSGRFIPAKIFIQDTRIEFKSDGKKADSVTFDSLSDLPTLIGPLLADLRQIELDNASIFVDKNDLGLKNMDVLIRQPAADHLEREVRAKGLFSDVNSSVPFQLEGTVRSPSNDMDKASIDVDLIITDVPLVRIPWPDEVQFRSGRATTELKFSGPVGANLTIEGLVTAEGLRFAVVKKGRSKDYDISRADIDFRGQVGLKNGRIESLTFRMPETRIALTLDLDWRETESMGMDLDISTRPISLPVFKRIFPTPLVPEWIETRLFPLFKDGSAKMDRFRLNGTIDQIKKLKRPGNSEALEMRLILGGLTALPDDPALAVTEVEGTVEINRGRLLVTGVNGKFGGSYLRQGSMTWPDLYGDSDVFNLGIQGDFLLEDLKDQGKHPIVPRAIRHEIDRFSAAKGPVAADIDLIFLDPRSLPALTGTIVMNNCQLTHTALLLPLDLITGKIVIDQNGPINLSGSGQWGGSAFEVNGTTGRLWNADGKIPQPNVDLAINADFALADVLKLRNTSILPAKFRSVSAGIKTIKGRLAANFTLQQPAPSSPIRMSGTFTTAGSSLVHTSLKLPLFIRQGRWVITDKDKNHFSANGSWGRSSFTAKGTTSEVKKFLQATISTDADINEIFERIYPENRAVIHVNNTLKSNIHIRKTDARWFFEGEVDLDGRTFQFPAVTLSPPGTGNRLAFNVVYTLPTGIAFKTRFVGKTSGFAIHGTLGQRQKGNHTIEIAPDPLNLADLGLRIAGKDEFLGGILQGHIKADLVPDRLEETRVNGKLILNGYLFDGNTASVPYNSDLRFKDRSIDIISLTLPYGGGTVTANGHFTGWERWHGQLNLSTDRIDLPRLIRQLRESKLDTPTTPSAGRGLLSILLSKSDLDIEVGADQVLWETIDLGNLMATAKYRNSAFRIDKAVFSASDGLIELSGTLSGDKEKRISLLAYVKLDQKPLDAILHGLDVNTDRIAGTISLEGDVLLNGRNKAEIIRNLAGKFNLEVTEGEVKKSHIIVKILDFLSIQNIFQKRPPDILRDRFYFESVQGHLNIKNGIITTERLFMQSPVFNAAARGRFELTRDYVNIFVGVQPLNTIDKIVSNIPIIGHILTGENRTIFVYYLKIRGTLDNLVLKQIPLKNLDQAIAGYFKRLFLTPARLWAKVFDTLEEIDKNLRSEPQQPDETDPYDMGP